MRLTNTVATLALASVLAGCAATGPTGKTATVPAGVPEMNNLESARLVDDWLRARVR